MDFLLCAYFSQLHTCIVFLIVSTAKTGPLKFLLLLYTQACHNDNSSKLIFSWFCSRRMQDIYVSSQALLRPNSCSSPSLTWFTQTQRKITTNSKNKGRRSRSIFSEMGPSVWELRKTNWLSHLYKGQKKDDIQNYALYTPSDKFSLNEYPVHCSFCAKLWDSGILAEPCVTIWVKIYKT